MLSKENFVVCVLHHDEEILAQKFLNQCISNSEYFNESGPKIRSVQILQKSTKFFQNFV